LNGEIIKRSVKTFVAPRLMENEGI